MKTGKGLINTALRYMPEMHLSLPNTVESENIPNGSFQNTGKYSYCGPGTKVRNECLKAIKELINWIMHVKSMTHTIQSIKIHKQEMLQMIYLLVRASQIALNPNLPDYERKDARLVTGIMGVKSRFGMGIKKNSTMKKN